MNHMQVLKTAEEQSKKAGTELTKAVRDNMTRLERDLKRQTTNVLRDFRASLRSTLQHAYSDHMKILKQRQLLLWMPLLLCCLLLGVTLLLVQQKLDTLSAIKGLMAYQTMTYQGQSYVIVPPTNILKTQNGQYLVKVN